MIKCALLLIACAACATDPAQQAGIDGVTHVEVHDMPAAPAPELDVLFVVDDSAAIAPYLDRIAQLPLLLEEAFPVLGAGIMDMHIAVTTTGELRQLPAIGGSYMTLHTEYDLTRLTNFTGTLRETLGALLTVGSSASSFQPLAAIRRVAENPAGFVRANAALGIVIVSASDDASPGDVADYVQAIKSTKTDPARIVVTGIVTAPSPRLAELLASFPNRNRVVSLADGDPRTIMELLAGQIRTILPLSCWSASDVDPETPGPQYDCTVTATIRGIDRVLLPCKLATDLFCWSLVDHSNGCLEKPAVGPRMPPWGEYVFHPAFRAECVVNP